MSSGEAKFHAHTSGDSIVVVLNALRIGRRERRGSAPAPKLVPAAA